MTQSQNRVECNTAASPTETLAIKVISTGGIALFLGVIMMLFLIGNSKRLDVVMQAIVWGGIAAIVGGCLMVIWS